MEVIALRGKHDSGKSATLMNVYSLLQQNGYIPVAGHYQVLSGGGDVYDVLSNGKQTIGIITRGDVGKWLEDDLATLQKAGCKQAICACRSRGYTNDAVENYKHKYVSKVLENNPGRQHTINAAQAQALLALI